VSVSRDKARALVVGVGGLGCPAAMVLARAGVGVIGIADDDVVEATNLHRQILFDDADVGAPKLDVAKRALAKIAPRCDVRVHATRVLPHNAVEIMSQYDIVLEGSDNFATKFLVADACAIARVPVVHAAAVRWRGTVLAVHGRPCYRCLFEDLPEGDAPNCADAGVVGPMVGVVGAIQGDLALAVIDGKSVGGELVTFDGKNSETRRRTIRPREGCALCSAASSIRSIERDRYVNALACDA
jgi:molybdopterin/thiamine biosynthesis adenylyltransferase